MSDNTIGVYMCPQCHMPVKCGTHCSFCWANRRPPWSDRHPPVWKPPKPSPITADGIITLIQELRDETNETLKMAEDEAAGQIADPDEFVDLKGKLDILDELLERVQQLKGEQQ